MHRASPRQTKTRHFRRYIAGGIIAITSVYLATVLLWPLQPIAPTHITKHSTVAASAQPAWPTPYGALGTIESGVLGTSSETQVPIASITKIITALVILEEKPLKQGELGPVVPITDADITLYNNYIAADGSVAPITSGMQITELQLLQGMLLNSANNYADTAAIWAYGSMDTYLAAAKTYLAKHGFSRTHVVDATGFSPNSKSTPKELIQLGILAMKHPVLADIVAQKTATVPGVGTFTNTNKLLGTNGIIGLKTGTTNEAGSCLLFASQFTTGDKPVTLVGVVLGAPDHPTLFQNVSTLTQQTTDQFKNREIVPANTVFAHYKTPWGATAKSTSASISQLTWTGANATLHTQHNNIQPATNRKSGTLTVTIGSRATTHDLALDKPLHGPSMWWRITHPRYIFGT